MPVVNSPIVTAAEGVTTHLLAQELTLTPAIERTYADLEERLENAIEGENPPRIDVTGVIHEQVVESASRGKLRYLCPVDILIRRKFEPKDYDEETGRVTKANVDEMTLLVQEVVEACSQQRIAESETIDMVWQSCKIVVSPVTKHLRELKQFTAILRVTFRTDREIPEAV